MTGDRHRHSTA